MGNTTGSDLAYLSGGRAGTCGLLPWAAVPQTPPAPGVASPLCFLPSFQSRFWPDEGPVTLGSFSRGTCFNHGLTETQVGLPLPSGSPRGRWDCGPPAGLCLYYEALTLISPDHSWNFLRSPKLFLESNCSSKLLPPSPPPQFYISISWSRNKSQFGLKKKKLAVGRRRSAQPFFQRSG